MQEQILDAEEVAQWLRLDERTVKRMASRGELTGFRAAGKWRFRKEAIEEFIRNKEAQATEKPKE